MGYSCGQTKGLIAAIQHTDVGFITFFL